MAPNEVAARVAKGSFYCIYLISAFSRTLDLAEKLADLCGYAGRITEMLHIVDSASVRPLCPSRTTTLPSSRNYFSLSF